MIHYSLFTQNHKGVEVKKRDHTKIKKVANSDHSFSDSWPDLHTVSIPQQNIKVTWSEYQLHGQRHFFF